MLTAISDKDIAVGATSCRIISRFDVYFDDELEKTTQHDEAKERKETLFVYPIGHRSGQES
jgi:hypothetical protein